ncbi:aprataxin and PNK-like factor isoform X2 [Melanotaenia boesemani]|nr:aprataxin and PNK-like factor isoform X2 [Melanotaenia boesemani]
MKDCWHRLHHGELFSLLLGHYIYRVEAVGGEEHTSRNAQMFEEEENPSDDGRGQEPPAALSDQTESPSRTFRQDVQNDVAAPRRRVLPAWMMAAVASSPLKAVKRSKQPAASKLAATTQAPPTATSSPEGPELSEEEDEKKRPRKKMREMCDEEEKKAQIKAKGPEKLLGGDQNKASRHEVSSRSNINMEAPADGKGGSLTWKPDVSQSDEDIKSRNTENTEGSESDRSTGRSASVPAPSKPQVRTPCPYGKDCYRKNPLHFQECSHPGDTDYEEEEEEEEADRPECPYGTSCYRKNPLHRKEFRHTSRPARSTRTVTKAAPDEDEDEYEDSFINDDSEDICNDSDYVPPVSDDSDKEDVQRLQREAKAFLKRSK